MLSPGEVALVNGYNNFGEQNIDIYVHTLVTPTTILRQQENNQNTNTNSNNQDLRNIVNQQGNIIQRNSQNRTNDISIQTGNNEDQRHIHSANNNINIIPNNQSSLNSRSTHINQHSTTLNNNNLFSNNQSSNNLENIMTMISNSMSSLN